MKKLLLLALFSNLAIAQESVEIRLVNPLVGYSNNVNPISNAYVGTNDSGLNAILETHNVNVYISKGGHPYEPYTNKYWAILCNGCNMNALVADLQAYSTVVEYVGITEMNYFNGIVNAQIATPGIGIPLDTNNNIVVTNDSALNQIFQDFNVFAYYQAFPGFGSETLQRYYYAVCNCDETALRAALDAYTSVISATEYVNAAFLLDVPEHSSIKTFIFPNPFTDKINIESNLEITRYAIYDVFGTQVASKASKQNFDSEIGKIASGMYLLKVDFSNGQTCSYKIIRK